MNAKTAKAAAAILEEIQAASNPAAEPDDSEWKTSAQWAAILGKSSSSVARYLTPAVSAGIMEMQMRQKRYVTGRVVPTPHYRYVEKKKRGRRQCTA